MKSSILFGNGMNLMSTNSVSWSTLLLDLKGKYKFHSENTPNTLIYERIVLDRVFRNKNHKSTIDTIETDVKDEIANKLATQNSNEIYKKIIELKLENYMTTNYDYAFKNSFDSPSEIINNSTESLYSIRRHTSIVNRESKYKIWNIHGEIDMPKSIKLGLDHYCGSIGKIDSYIKGSYSFTLNEKMIKVKEMKYKLENNDFDRYSWVELFFTSNIHIIGLSLDFSETDLWWVLDKRARMCSTGLIKNKIFIYVNDSFGMEKSELLNSLGVHVEIVKLVDNDYFNFYSSAVEIIKNNIIKYDSI